jgi:hypothetical protein
MTLPQVQLYHKELMTKKRLDAADSLYLAALVQSGDSKAINRKLEELRGNVSSHD